MDFSQFRENKTHGRPEAVMSVALPGISNPELSTEANEVEDDAPLDHLASEDAFQSLPLRSNASKFQLASKTTHGDARTTTGKKR